MPNSDIANAIEEYRKVRHGEGPAGGKALPALDETLAQKSLAELGAMFSLLDGLRQLLDEYLLRAAETLEMWQPPDLAVVGQESTSAA